MEQEKPECRAFSLAQSMPLSFPIIKSDENNTFLKALTGSSTKSNQKDNVGDVEPPIDMEKAASFRISNEHHSACLSTKVHATVGLGFADSREVTTKVDPATGMVEKKVKEVESKVDLLLDPLCDDSWASLLTEVTEDFWEVSVGYIEVTREKQEQTSKINGLFLIPASTCRVHIDDETGEYHFITNSGDGNDKHFARFGDLDRVKALFPDLKNISEVIRFKQPSSLSKWYGYPDWLAALASIELSQCLKQYKYDFYNNRGVPELLVTVTGGQLDEDTWTALENALAANIGKGNTQKTVALNIPNPEIKIEVEKLAMEGKGDGDTFENNTNTLALNVVTAHQVPPLLAGIQIPGKLGANNELPNALMSFQLLKIGPAQRLFVQTLRNTLGKEDGLGLDTSLLVFRTITEEIDLNKMETIGGMRQTLPEAQAEGRDLSTGPKD